MITACSQPLETSRPRFAAGAGTSSVSGSRFFHRQPPGAEPNTSPRSIGKKTRLTPRVRQNGLWTCPRQDQMTFSARRRAPGCSRWSATSAGRRGRKSWHSGWACTQTACGSISIASARAACWRRAVRPRSRGRPRDMWSVSPSAEPGGSPPRAYGDLARWLARATPPTKARLREVENAGREIGRELAPTTPDPRTAALRDTLTGLGFQPALEGNARSPALPAGELPLPQLGQGEPRGRLHPAPGHHRAASST